MRFLAIILLTLFYTGKTTASDSIPKDAIPFFSFKNNVILDGILNDSVSIKALLDIGAWGIAIPDKHGEGLQKYEKLSFRIGSWEKKLPVTFMSHGSQFLNWYGEDCVLLGWDFFDREILEISYTKHYIRVLDRLHLDSLTRGYNQVNFQNRGKRLLVEGEVTVQNKKIEGNFWIDTGLNGTLFFTHNIPKQYGLDLSKTKEGRAKNLDTNRTKISILKTDSIRIGNSCLIDRDIFFSESEWFVFHENELYVGLLGNQFFKNFSVIFDFRENILYLKEE